MFATFLKKYSLHLLVGLGFLLITIAYFSPLFFEKKMLMAGDAIQGMGGTRELTQFETETGTPSLWTSTLFSGMPSIMVYTNFSSNLFQRVYALISFGLPRGADIVFLSLISFYILLSVYGVRPILAAAGAFAYTFSTYSIVSIEAGHNAKVCAMALMPLIIAGIVYAYRKNILGGSALMAAGLALNLVTNHVQVTFYAALTALFFVASEFIFSVLNKNIKHFFLASFGLAIGALLAVGTNAAYLLTVTEYGQYSIRGKTELTPKEKDANIVSSDGLDKDYAFDWSYTPAETMTLLIPRFYGGSSNENVGKNSNTYETLTQKGVPATSAKDFTSSLPTYWGELPFTSGPLYVGAIILFLFVLGLLLEEGRNKYWLLGATVLSLFLIWGKHFPAFNYFLFDHLPLFNKFRAVMMAIVIAQLCMPVLALIALEKMLRSAEKEDALKKKLFVSAGITAGLCLIVFLIAGTFDFTSSGDVQLLENFKNMTGDAAFAQQLVDAILEDRQSLMRSDALRSAVLILLSAGLIYLFITRKIKEIMVVAGVTVLIFFDLWALDKNYLNNSNFQKKSANTYLAPSAADEYILKDTALSYRVYNLSGNPFTENRTSYFHKSIGGNNPAKLRRYQDLIERQLSKNNEKVLNMLNAKYAIISPEQPPQLIPGALGNAWFVSEVKEVKSADDEMAALDNFEPARTAVVDISKFKVPVTKFDNSQATIALKEAKPNALTYVSNSTANGLAVFSEIYFPIGWTATIDGKPADLIRANYVLRALHVPAGSHTIEMRFDLPNYHKGNKISLISSILLLAGIVGVVIFQTVKNRKEETPQ